MLLVKDFFANFAGEGSVPSEQDLQPIQQFLINAGAEFCIDSENAEIDEFIIAGLTDQFENYNWELVFEHNGYEIYGVSTLKCWILKWRDAEINGAPDSWFVG